MDTSWIMNGLGLAEKIRSATQSFTLRLGELFAKPRTKCTYCDCVIDISNVSLVWPALPAGVKFDPTDLEILQHLQEKSSLPNSVSHTLIDEFIPTIKEEEGICYTHPKNFPGIKMDGSYLHFFNRVLNAYDTGTRKRRRIIATGDICDGVVNGNSRWHKTGASKPVFDENGVRKGWKKILVLYKAPKKVGDRPERENWVMHQYHLGVNEDESNGEFVVCKGEEECGTSKMKTEAAECSACFAESSPAIPTSDAPVRTPMTDRPQPRRLNNSRCNTRRCTPIQSDQGAEECGTSKVKIEAAECSSACIAELSPAIPTSAEPMQPTDALDASLPVDDLFHGLLDLDNTLPFTETPSGGGISLDDIFGPLDSLGAWPDGFL
ncbi:NAC domain containing protein 44 [Zea mays]|uniref:NAC domain containing protein 44 n=1 Tax=Zea mays TaxID=4577 RepID=A0A1D6E8F8_MAIZE|nr:NAC domain containing protein 44 [Zea mays]